MKVKIITVFCFFICFFAFSDQSSDILNLDIDTAVKIALKNNLGIEKEKIKLETYTWAMATSFNKFYPTISLSFSMSHLDDDAMSKKYPQLAVKDDLKSIPSGFYPTGVPYYGPSDSHIYGFVYSPEVPSWSVGMNYSISFALNAAMCFSVYQTVLDFQTGKLSKETAEKKLNRDVKKAYYRLLLSKANIDLMNDKINSAGKRYEQAKINKQNGTISEIDELSAKAAYENLKPVCTDLVNYYKKSLLAFKQMVGIKENVEMNLITNMPEIQKQNLDPDMLFTKYINNKLELRLLNMNLNSLENLRSINIAGLTPNFLLSYSINPVYIKDPFNGNNNWFSNINDDWKNMGGIFTLAVSLPLTSWIPFSNDQMKIVNSNFAIKDMFNTIAQTKLQSKLELESNVLDIEKSFKSIETLKTNIELSERVYSMTEEAYKLGIKKLLEIEDAENELNNAKLNLLKTQLDYISAMLDLEYSIDTKLEEAK